MIRFNTSDDVFRVVSHLYTLILHYSFSSCGLKQFVALYVDLLMANYMMFSHNREACYLKLLWMLWVDWHSAYKWRKMALEWRTFTSPLFPKVTLRSAPAKAANISRSTKPIIMARAQKDCVKIHRTDMPSKMINTSYNSHVLKHFVAETSSFFKCPGCHTSCEWAKQFNDLSQ